MNQNINNTTLIQNIDVLNIAEDIKIEINLCKKRVNVFFDVILNLKGKEIFLGRFNKLHNTVKAKYNNGKILIYNDEFNDNTKQMEIIKVLSLYEMIDDTFYSCTEAEALNIFDSSIDISYLKDKNNPIYRSDIEKRKRLK